MGELIEVIVRYYGNIEELKEKYDIQIEILSESYAIITAGEEEIEEIRQEPEIIYIEYPKNLKLMVEANLRKSCITEEFYNETGLTGKGVIVAIIDSGIDYTNRDFIDENGESRILYIWDQSTDGNPPIGFNEGNEITNEEINNALAENIRLPFDDFEGHGTAVAGIAAGNGRYRGIAPEAKLIIVKLGRRGTARTTELMRGIKYIYDKGKQLNMPIAINISYGTNDGSHEGNSLFETYIDDMALREKSSIIVASGNEGDTAHHYRGKLYQGDTETVEFSIGTEITSVFLTLWKNYNDNFRLELINPSGNTMGNENIAINNPTPYNLSQEIYIRLPRPQIRNWRLKLYGENIVNGEFDIWLPVTESSTRETVFFNPSIDTTLTLPATALRVITVGGYNSLTDSISVFSGRGYTRQNEIIKPDIVAPANNITATNVGGGYDSFTGTSFAAPHVTGAVAILMEWGIVNGNSPFLYGERMKAYLQKGARRKSNIIYPNREWGDCVKLVLG